MTQNNQQKLGKILWSIANNLRGAMIADNYNSCDYSKTESNRKSPHF